MPLSRHRTTAAGLALAAALSLAAAGCGGGKSDTSDAVVIPGSDANLSAAPSGGTNPTPGASATNPAPAANTSASATPTAPTTAEGWGTLKGQVVFGGNPPPHENLYDQGKAPKNPEVCSKDAAIPEERLIVDGATKGVKNVIVYIPKPTAVNPEAKSAASSAKVEFDQQNCTFKPHVLAVMAGGQVNMKSSDPGINHNVHANLRANNGFNELLSGGQEKSTPPKALNSAERSPAQVTCDIHPWMKAWWLVLDNPYFAVTDDKGNYEIKNVPAGTQKVVVWQEAVSKGGFVTAASGEAVTVQADGTTTKDFTIDPGKLLSGK